MPTYTLAQLESRTWDQLDGNTGEFPEPNVRAVLNHGLSRFNLVVGIQSATIPVTGFTVANQFAYNCPAGLMIPVRYDYEGRELQKMPLDRLARAFPSWVTDNSSNLGPPARVGVIDLTQFILHPADAYGGGLLEVTGIVPMTPLVNQGDVVTLDDQWAECLIAYAKPRLLVKEGGKAFADAVQAFKPYRDKMREASIWKSVIWSQQDLSKRTQMASERWPV